MQRITSNRKPNVGHSSTSSKEQKPNGDGRLCGVKGIVGAGLGVCLLMVVLNIYEFHSSETKIRNNIDRVTASNLEEMKAPTFALYGKNVDSGYLKHVLNVFERLGFQRVGINSTWDVLWAHEYPFRAMYSTLRNLKDHQKVNHFPGCGYITNKAELSTSKLPHIPHAFRIPEEKELLFKHAKRNPNMLFVQKDNNHRGITIKHIDELNLTAKGSFVQEYVSNPLLVDGYKFDIGVYTVVTSIDPLRVYIYMGDILFRFCPVKYHPFDPKILDKYVVGDDYLPIWEVPSLKKVYVDMGFSMKESFDTYLQTQGKDPAIVWNQVNEAIQSIFLQKESKIVQSTSYYRSVTNFFEMMRIDFVIDEDLNVFLMEANMSPNLSSAHFPPNQLLYEQVVFNTLALVGVARHIKSGSLQSYSLAEEEMCVAMKNIVVFPLLCNQKQCQSCVNPECQLCKQCLTYQSIAKLKRAYNEHVNRLDYRRIFPPPLERQELNNSGYHNLLNEYSPENQFMYRWFVGKCQLDKSWCS